MIELGVAAAVVQEIAVDDQIASTARYAAVNARAIPVRNVEIREEDVISTAGQTDRVVAEGAARLC